MTFYEILVNAVRCGLLREGRWFALLVLVMLLIILSLVIEMRGKIYKKLGIKDKKRSVK